MARDTCLERDPPAERVAGEVRPAQLLLGEELGERIAQDVDHRASVGDERIGLAVPRQVDEHDLALLGELVEHRVPRLAAVTDPVHQHQRRTGPDALERHPHRHVPPPRPWAAPRDGADVTRW